MARTTSTSFDLLAEDDMGVRGLESLISDPSIIVESRRLKYIEAEEISEDEFTPAQLIMTVSYSKYNEVVQTDNYYKRARLFTSFGFASNSETYLEEFLESPNRIIDSSMMYMNDIMTYTIVEFIDRKYSLANKEDDAGLSLKKLVRFDEYLGEYVPIEPTEED